MDLKLVQTCCACPEQYEVFYREKQVGYIRYRNGRLTCECPDCFEEMVIDKQIGGLYNSVLSKKDRADILEECFNKIEDWIIRSLYN